MSNRYQLTDGNIILADADFIAAHHPGALRLPNEQMLAPPRLVTVLAFRDRFSDGEKIAIYTAAKTEVAVQVWLDDLAAAQNQTVDLNDQRIIGGVNAMEFGGLIAAGRAAVILA